MTALARLGLVAALGLAASLASADPAPTEAGRAVRVEHHDPSAPPARGPVDALVTIEVFFAPGGTVSGPSGLALLEALQAEHPSRIRLVYRVVASGGQVMVPSALLEAHAQGKFFAMLDALRARPARLDRAGLIELAGRVGLDVPRVVAALAHGSDALDENAARLRRFHRQAPEALFNGVPLSRTLSTVDHAALASAYTDTLEAALDLVDRGADPRALADAFTQDALAAVNPDVQPMGDTDDDVEVEPTEPRLAAPPLSLAGLPSFGRPDATIPIVLLCSPLSTRCRANLDRALDVQRVYPDDVRVVWAPYYDVGRPDAVDLGLLADAALCAERVGTAATVDGEPSSSGWRWITGVLALMQARHGRRVPALETIDAMTRSLRVDEHAFSACRAASAGDAIERIAAARHSGVRGAPTVIVGGRIYLRGLADVASLQRLVEAELAPGVLGQLAPSWQRAP